MKEILDCSQLNSGHYWIKFKQDSSEEWKLVWINKSFSGCWQAYEMGWDIPWSVNLEEFVMIKAEIISPDGKNYV